VARKRRNQIKLVLTKEKTRKTNNATLGIAPRELLKGTQVSHSDSMRQGSRFKKFG